jgi:hypothetical protein
MSMKLEAEPVELVWVRFGVLGGDPLVTPPTRVAG